MRPGNRVCNEWCKNAHALVRSHRNHPALPAQWFTAYNVISPVNGFLATVALRVFAQDLTPAPRMSGPHVFARPLQALSSRAPAASTAPRPAS